MGSELGRLPTLHIIGDSIPQAYYRALQAVWKQGAEVRTEYDRRDDKGNYIDPPGRDARVLIEVRDPFAQPRYPPISHCEIGTYIAEIMGAKDHRVIPIQLLMKIEAKKNAKIPLTPVEKAFENHWPYSYHQRLFDHPETTGKTVDQVALAVERVAKTPFTRRAVCTTSVPNFDPYLVDDNPCLRELMLCCLEDNEDALALNPSTTWRSRDLYKAWGDNVIGLTFLMARIADKISGKCGRKVKVGSYADYSVRLHIYGQDFSHVAGDKSKGLSGFFDTFMDEDIFMERSLTSEMAADMLVLPQLQNLVSPAQVRQWEFRAEQLRIIHDLIDGIKSGRYIC